MIDPATNRVYVVVDSQTHRAAMAALRRQQDRDAIAEGISQMEAGEGKPLRDMEAEMCAEFGYLPRAWRATGTPSFRLRKLSSASWVSPLSRRS